MEPKIELTMDGYVECDGLTEVWLAENQLRCAKCAWRAPYVHSPERLRHYRVTADDSERLREAEATLARVEELAHYRLSSRSRLPHTPIYRLGFEDCQRYLRAALSPAPAVAEARQCGTTKSKHCRLGEGHKGDHIYYGDEPPASAIAQGDERASIIEEGAVFFSLVALVQSINGGVIDSNQTQLCRTVTQAIIAAARISKEA